MYFYLLILFLFSFDAPDARYYPWIQEFRSHYDMVIIGGGLVGSCIANFLAERVKVSAFEYNSLEVLKTWSSLAGYLYS